eukprot:19198-Heterococcus_DN1.PRE.1
MQCHCMDVVLETSACTQQYVRSRTVYQASNSTMVCSSYFRLVRAAVSVRCVCKLLDDIGNSSTSVMHCSASSST